MGYLTLARSCRPLETDIASAVHAFDTEVPARDHGLWPEWSDLIELGGKMDLMDGRVGLTAALFRMTLPPTFIRFERGSEPEFCRFRRVGQRGLARSFADRAASDPVAG